MVLEANSATSDTNGWGSTSKSTASQRSSAATGGGGSFSAGGMPYVFVRENAIKYWCTVQGLSHNEVRVLAEKVQDQPEHQDDRLKRAEFSLPTWLVLNALEVMGFKVVTSGPYVTGMAKHDQREFVWTLHKTHDEWESSSK